MRRFELFFALWAGMIFCGLCSVRAQEGPSNTLHSFTPQVDTVRLSFEDVLQLSVQYDSADKDDWRYLYRWNTGDRTDAVQVKFEGKRKLLYIGQRLSAIHWPEEYDTFFAAKRLIWYATDPEEDSCVVCAPTSVQYVWHDYSWDNEKLRVFGTEQCIYAHAAMKLFRDQRPISQPLYCSPYAVSPDETSHRDDPGLKLYFDTVSGIKQRMHGAAQRHVLNVWDMPRGTQIYARLRDSIHFFSKLNPTLYPEQEGHEILDGPTIWNVCPDNLYHNTIRDSVIDIYFKDSIFIGRVETFIRYVDMGPWQSPRSVYHYVYFGIKPNAQIETDSVWVFFPQYPYSNLGDVVDICLPHDAPLPLADDTMQVFNLGPWNRELEYVEYAWFDGTKTASGADSVVGTDSAFAYLFGRMDSVAPDLYAGTLVTRVASDSLWQDTCSCYIPCTDAACSGYDTVRIFLHRLPKHNSFFPRDSVLCAHLDLELDLSGTADAYRCFWLDRDSIEMPYGHDTARFTVQGMRGLDGFGAGTDTREPRFFQLRLDHKLCGVSFFDTLLVYDQVKPDFVLPFHDTIICRNEPVKLDSLSPHVYRTFYTFEWNDGKKGSDYTFTDSGTYILRFFVEKKFAFCGYDTATDTLRTVWVDPAMTDIFLPADTTFCKDLSVTLDVRVPFPSTRYSWQDGPMPDPEEEFEDEQDTIIFTSPIKTIKEEGTYNVLLLDTMGCRNRQEIEVTIDDCKPAIEIPNVFTPNGDGVNDVWRFKQLEKCTDVVIEVVDRWGQPVLKKKVPSADDFEWNGRVNNTGARLPDGPYFYMVTYKNLYGKSKVQSGSITILGTGE